MVLVVSVSVGTTAWADLSIYEVQHNTTDGDASVYNGQIQSVLGGIVTHTWHGFQDRIYLQDPNQADGWGAIVVKDSTPTRELYSSVSVGDWVTLSEVYVEEYRGTTFLQYKTVTDGGGNVLNPNLGFEVTSVGNPVPASVVLTAAELVVPVDHAASEPWESVIVTLEDVVIGQKDLGKAADNYQLLQGSDVAWGTDYLNLEAGGLYHPYIQTGVHLESITGIVEQYTKLSDGWDYYQVMTRCTADIVVPEPGTLALVAVGLVVLRRSRRATA